eukprot:symbB.v1.2.013080.t1/scaffold920.1/size152120/2
MLRVWMLLVVGAAAMRQAAEDAVASSAVKEEWKKKDEKRLRSAAEEVAWKNFPKKERRPLTKAVMEAFKSGELDFKGLKEMSWEEKQRYLLTTMQQMQDLRSLRSAAEEVAKKNFPEKEQQKLTEAVMEAFQNAVKEMSAAEKVAKEHFPEKELYRLTEPVMEAFRRKELDKDWNEIAEMDQEGLEWYLVVTMNRLRELPVAASAVKFCSELFREANSKAAKSEELQVITKLAEDAAKQEAQEATKICHKVLTGELGRGPKWAKKAANSSQPKGQHLKRGRLEKVDAAETAWKVSVKNVCRDECHELVKEMKKKAWEIAEDVGYPRKPPSYEEVCAKRVVQKVEAEILGCCAESCGWNGRACMYWPFLSSTEKGKWEAECCTEFNILKGSSRATMCDATLTREENNEVIRDEQPNTEEEREMIGQDPVLKGTSFLQSEDTNGPTPLPEYKPIPTAKGKCPPPLDLGEVHAKLKKEWKTTAFPLARNKFTPRDSFYQKFLGDPQSTRILRRLDFF